MLENTHCFIVTRFITMYNLERPNRTEMSTQPHFMKGRHFLDQGKRDFACNNSIKAVLSLYMYSPDLITGSSPTSLGSLFFFSFPPPLPPSTTARGSDMFPLFSWRPCSTGGPRFWGRFFWLWRNRRRNQRRSRLRNRSGNRRRNRRGKRQKKTAGVI